MPLQAQHARIRALRARPVHICRDPFPEKMTGRTVRLRLRLSGVLPGRRTFSRPRHIHYSSLDIEGAELEALRGFPVDRHSIGAMTIEHNDEEPKRSAIEQLLRDRGYKRVRTWQQDDFYLPAKPN